MNALTASCMPSSSGVSIIINNSNSSSPTARAAACTPAQPLRPTAAAHKLRNVQCSCQPRATSKNTSQLDARGLSYLGDSIWSVSTICGVTATLCVLLLHLWLRPVSLDAVLLLGEHMCLTPPHASRCLQLCVRRHFFTPPKHWRTYQEMVQPYVTAEGQVRCGMVCPASIAVTSCCGPGPYKLQTAADIPDGDRALGKENVSLGIA